MCARARARSRERRAVARRASSDPMPVSWGALLGSWFEGHAFSGYGWGAAQGGESSCGDNGLYGGQLQPCAIFLATIGLIWLLLRCFFT